MKHVNEADSERMVKDLAEVLARKLKEGDIKTLLLCYYDEYDLVQELFRKGWKRGSLSSPPPKGAKVLYKP